MKLYTKAYFFNGIDLVAERELLGLSQTEFASRAGWTQPYQSKLECSMAHQLTIEIKEGFGAAGVKFVDCGAS
ncbi:MAG: helix-turn-helix transcriptional regulator [Sedimentisphaerales bacterium]|nr:helix-turn-helix transcriptional regulator [Sedimentisphaerales bacterium]